MAKKEKSNRSKKAEDALDLYLYTDKSQKEICAIVGWTEKTFTENKTKGNWEAMKGATTITAQKIIMKLYERLEILSHADQLQPDGLFKIAKSIEMLSNKKNTLSQHINCAKEFTTYLFGVDPELAKKLNKHQQDFINTLVSNGN